jgi:small neutral amino acid transporter SnatA (MarC family)
MKASWQYSYFADAQKHAPPKRRPQVILREIWIAFGLLLPIMFVGEGFLSLMPLLQS